MLAAQSADNMSDLFMLFRVESYLRPYQFFAFSLFQTRLEIFHEAFGSATCGLKQHVFPLFFGGDTAHVADLGPKEHVIDFRGEIASRSDT